MEVIKAVIVIVSLDITFGSPNYGRAHHVFGFLKGRYLTDE